MLANSGTYGIYGIYGIYAEMIRHEQSGTVTVYPPDGDAFEAHSGRRKHPGRTALRSRPASPGPPG